MIKKNKYKLFFTDGKRLVVKGYTIEEAIEEHIVCDVPCTNENIEKYLDTIEGYLELDY